MHVIKRRIGFFLFVAQTLICFSCSRRIIPDQPFLSQTVFHYDSLPVSVLNIPVQINLKPLYHLAEKNIDTFFTSPDFPNEWINADCATRYKYQFRRGPLQFSTMGNSMNISFTGYYRIIGSTRICSGNTVISPWTPPCRCGYEEGERRVLVSFASQLNITPDYKARITIKSEEPVPIDKCSVCFFGVDITGQVMNGLKKELDISIKDMQDSLSVIDLRKDIQEIWNKVSQPYNIYDLGWLQINPAAISLQELKTNNDSLNLRFSVSAKPGLHLNKPVEILTLLPDLKQSQPATGFNIFLDAMLNYDSLSTILTHVFGGKEFEFRKKSMRKTVIVKNCRIYGSGNELLILKLEFTGTHTGLVYFTGMPYYDPVTATFSIRNIDFDIRTRNFLLGNADWLFNKRITAELESFTHFDLKPYIDTARSRLNKYLERNWYNGVHSMGQISDLNIISFYPMADHLVIRSQARGDFSIRIDDPVAGFR